jgi:GT2 family glycosyltransferase
VKPPQSANPNVAGRPHVYIVVLNWNGSQDTRTCIDSLRQTAYPNAVYLVCDNASDSADLEQLRNWGAGLPGGLAEVAVGTGQVNLGLATPSVGQTLLLHTGDNLGFAGGVNLGLRFAAAQPDFEYAWVLNNDTEVEAGALDKLVDRMQSDPDIGICGSTLVYHGKREQVQALGGASYQPWRGRSRALGAFSAVREIPANPSAVEARMDYVVGAAMLISRRFLEVVGPMDDRYFLYSEEHDWAHRGRKMGFKLAWVPGSMVFHKHGATIGTSAHGGSSLSLFYLFRSKALFTWRHYPWRLPVVMIWLLWDGLKFLLKGHPTKAWASWRGIISFPFLGRF